MSPKSTKVASLLPSPDTIISGTATSGHIQLTVSILRFKSCQKSKTASADHPSPSVTPTLPFVS